MGNALEGAPAKFMPPAEGKTVYDEVGNAYVSVVGGVFQIGDKGEADTPIQMIGVRSFHMGSTEVTGKEWERILDWAKRNNYDFEHSGAARGEDHPVTDLSWYDVVKWCNAKSEKEGLKPCYYTSVSRSSGAVYRRGRVELTNAMVEWDASGYRLPTEAEWEKGARGGLVGMKYPHGNEMGKSVANFNSSFRNSGSKPVGEYTANRFGLFDMAGNVQEWCWDRYAADSYKSPVKQDPKGPDTGSDRVTRGGSWYGNAGKCRVARRDFSPMETAVGSLGFRVVRP